MTIREATNCSSLEPKVVIAAFVGILKCQSVNIFARESRVLQCLMCLAIGRR